MIQRNQIQTLDAPAQGGRDELAKALMQLNQPQVQTQQQQSQSPSMNMNMMEKFMPSGGAGADPYGFGSADPFSTASYAGGEGAVSGASTAGGSGGAAGGSSWGSMASSAGPWAALAAVIAINENEANGGGYRHDGADYWGDLFGGKVLEQDMNQRWLPDMFGEDMKHDDYGFGGDMKAGSELLSLDFSNALESLKGGTIGKLLGKF